MYTRSALEQEVCNTNIYLKPVVALMSDLVLLANVHPLYRMDFAKGLGVTLQEVIK